MYNGSCLKKRNTLLHVFRGLDRGSAVIKIRLLEQVYRIEVKILLVIATFLMQEPDSSSSYFMLSIPLHANVPGMQHMA